MRRLARKLGGWLQDLGVLVGAAMTVHAAWLWLAIVVILLWLLVSLWARGQVG